MAINGSFFTNQVNGRDLAFSWSLQNQSAASNTSTISWNLYGGGTNLERVTVKNFEVIINGHIVYISETSQGVYNGSLIKSGIFTLNHDDNGACSFTVNVEASISEEVITGSGSFSLPDISRVSVITLVTGSNLTDIFRAEYSKYSTSFKDNLEIALGDSVIQSINNYANGANFELTASAKAAIHAVSASTKVVTLKFSLKTYEGDSLIGVSNVYNKQVTIDDSNPTINSVTYADTNPVTEAITTNNSYIVQNKSLFTVTCSGLTAHNGATLSKLTAIFAGITKTVNLSGVTDAVEVVSFGTVDIATYSELKVILEDSRGNKTTVVKNVSVYAYNAPSAILTAQREEYYKSNTQILVNANISSIGGHNSVAILGYTKEKGASSYGSAFNITDGAVKTLTLDVLKAYDLKIEVIDLLETTAYYLSIDKGAPIVYIDKLKRSVGLGCFPQDQDSLEILGLNIYSALIYSAGDTYSASGLIVGGYVDTDSVAFSVILPKFKGALTPNLSELKLNIRDIDGNFVFAGSYTSGGYNVLADANITVSLIAEENYITVLLTNSSILPSPANTPVNIELNGLIIQFS